MKIAVAVLVALAMGAPSVTMSGDKARVIPAQEIKAQLDDLVPQAKQSGTAGPLIASYGNLGLMLSVRTTSGVGELHQHYDDLMIVEHGSATLVTGGSLAEPKTVSAGEIRGIGVQGGTLRDISVGDVVIVPAGVPHQLLVPAGTIYTSLVAKIKEQ
jgi:hypothetical protein